MICLLYTSIYENGRRLRNELCTGNLPAVLEQVNYVFDHLVRSSLDMNCCQANGSRGLSQVAEWAAFSDETGLYLNFYGPCAIAARTPAGRRIHLTEESAYPRDGAVTITLELDEPETFPRCV